MRRVLMTTGALVLGATSAMAGGLERTTQSVAIIFERGNYAELSFGSVKPSVSGVGAAFTPGLPSGDMAADYTQVGAAAKFSLSENLDAALIFDAPFGANVDYPVTGYYASGAVAELNTQAITGVLRYRMHSNVSMIGGLRYQTLEATASVPFIAGYTVSGVRDGGVGYLLGVAYEKPEIALRVALTYNSRIKHALATTEFGAPSADTLVDTPQSVNLEFQSGIAANTLLFGSVRWVEWSEFVIDPALYPPATPLVSYDSDTITYSLGIGRKLSDAWSVAASVGYEHPSGGFASNLGPTDGKSRVTLGATYTSGNMKLTGGVTYVAIGDADTTLGGGVAAGNFTGNHAVGFGLKLGFAF